MPAQNILHTPVLIVGGGPVGLGLAADLGQRGIKCLVTLYERKLVLVRPDGHVAWRADAMPDDPPAVVDRVRGA